MIILFVLIQIAICICRIFEFSSHCWDHSRCPLCHNIDSIAIGRAKVLMSFPSDWTSLVVVTDERRVGLARRCESWRTDANRRAAVSPIIQCVYSISLF